MFAFLKYYFKSLVLIQLNEILKMKIRSYVQITVKGSDFYISSVSLNKGDIEYLEYLNRNKMFLQTERDCVASMKTSKERFTKRPLAVID